MRRHGRRNRGYFFSQALPLRHGDGGVSCVGPLLAQVRCPVHRVLAFEVGQHGVKGALACVKRSPCGFDHVITQRVAHALGLQLVGVQLARAGVNGDFFVHQRLSHSRCVLLVVPQFAEANDVDHHVFMKFHAEVQRQLRGQHHGFWVVTVDVQHRRVNHFDDVGAIQC